MDILTTQEEVSGPVSIWAIPRASYQDDDTPPFTFELRTNTPYQTGCVKLNTETVTLMLPAGLNLIEKAIDTLRAAQAKAREECQNRVTDLEAEIQQLQMLTYTPPVDVTTIEPEVIGEVETIEPESELIEEDDNDDIPY